VFRDDQKANLRIFIWLHLVHLREAACLPDLCRRDASVATV
jgi:hypothetical protein